PAGDTRDTVVADALAVQTAMQQGRHFLLNNDSKSAVQVLEAQVHRINGNPAYLSQLRDAYRALIRDLRLNGQEAEAQRYLQRLQILDPGAPLDAAIKISGPAVPLSVAVAPGAAPIPARPTVPVSTAPVSAAPPVPAPAGPTLAAMAAATP